MSDGGEDVRRVQAYLHPDSEHWIDWFHITMRITVLQQQTKSLQSEANRVKGAAELSKRIESMTHLWHGNVAEALDRRSDMQLDLELIRGSFGGRQAGGRTGRIRNLHPQQSGFHSELRGALPASRDDQHGVCGVDDQSGGEPPFRQETTDVVDAQGRAPVAAGPNPRC
jgi:hypothetical protein